MCLLTPMASFGCHPLSRYSGRLQGTSACPSKPTSLLQTFPGCVQAELFLLHSLAFTKQLTLSCNYLSMTLPTPLISSRAGSLFTVPCAAQGRAHTVETENTEPRGLRKACYCCSCLFMGTPPRKAHCVFLLCQVVKRRGNGSSFPDCLQKKRINK